MNFWRRWPTCKRVVVNMVDGRAFDAVLYAKRGPLLELREAKLLDPDFATTLVDGAVLVERHRVAFIQVRDN